MVVMTRARKKQELQKEVLLKEEVLSGVVPKPLNTEGVTTPRTLSQEQKRYIRKDLGTKTQGEGLEYCNTKMKELQEKDISLSEAREAARKTDGTKGEWFYREGLLYRKRKRR